MYTNCFLYFLLLHQQLFLFFKEEMLFYFILFYFLKISPLGHIQHLFDGFRHL